MSACGGNNPQLWPPTDVDLTSSSLKDELWDDSEVVAQYDRIDAFVKKKLTTIYQERTGKLRPGRTNPVKSSPSNRRRSSSRKNPHVRTPSSSPRSSARRNGSSSVPSVSKLLVNGPEADFTPTYATTIPPCDYQWLPPILYPPDVLFNRRLTETANHGPPSTPFIPTVCRPNQNSGSPAGGAFQQVLQRWFEAGYKLGREHALQANRPNA